jgi:hypothetical protein
MISPLGWGLGVGLTTLPCKDGEILGFGLTYYRWYSLQTAKKWDILKGQTNCIQSKVGAGVAAASKSKFSWKLNCQMLPHVNNLFIANEMSEFSVHLDTWRARGTEMWNPQVSIYWQYVMYPAFAFWADLFNTTVPDNSLLQRFCR